MCSAGYKKTEPQTSTMEISQTLPFERSPLHRLVGIMFDVAFDISQGTSSIRFFLSDMLH